VAKLKVKVTVPSAQWSFSDVDPPVQLAGGEHELELSDRGDDLKTLRALGAAHAAGVLKLKASREALNKALTHVEGNDEATARILELENDDVYQAELDVVRDAMGAELNANFGRVTDALERATTDPDDEDAQAELEAALQEKTDLESDWHHRIAELRS
jgi:hypothetical protein